MSTGYNQKTSKRLTDSSIEKKKKKKKKKLSIYIKFFIECTRSVHEIKIFEFFVS